MANTRIPNLTIENARILFRNFSGKEGKFNAKGDRNFNVLLDEELANQLKADGWNVKYLKPREGEEDQTPQARLEVKVSYKGRPPRVVLITQTRRTNLDEETIDLLDWAEITNVDLIIRPYQWEVNGNTGIKAYLQSIYVTIWEDELEAKYADTPDSAMDAIDTKWDDAEAPY